MRWSRLSPGRDGTPRPRPDVCLARNPKLVYGRMTATAGRPAVERCRPRINYIALAGLLHTIGFPDRPPVRH